MKNAIFKKIATGLCLFTAMSGPLSSRDPDLTVPSINDTAFIFHRSLKKLSEESLTRPPEEVFDLLEKLGEG